jgi:sugar phosphate isomerase/epimerase
MQPPSQRLAIVSDEAAIDFAEAVSICLPLGLRAYELRNLPGGRIPFCDPAAIDTVIAQQKEHGLSLIGISPGFFKGTLDDPSVEVELTRGLGAALSLMDRLSVRTMTVFSFKRSSREAPIPQRAVDLLAQMAARCRVAGVRMLIENSASCWADTGDHLADLARSLNVQVTWDPANAQASGDQAFPGGYARVHDRIAHVHVKNWLPQKGWVNINDGQVDMAAQAAALLADGYKGYFCVEPHQWADRANATRSNTRQLLELLAAHTESQEEDS